MILRLLASQSNYRVLLSRNLSREQACNKGKTHTDKHENYSSAHRQYSLECFKSCQGEENDVDNSDEEQ